MLGVSLRRLNITLNSNEEGDVMSKRVEKFEDLIAWQKARRLTARIYKITGEGSFARDFNLKDQIRRAAVSIMSNIAEGFERNSSRLSPLSRNGQGLVC